MARQAINNWTEQDWQATVRYGDEHAGEFTPPPLPPIAVSDETERRIAEYNISVLSRFNQLFNR